MSSKHLLPPGTKVTTKDKLLYALSMGGIIPAYVLFASLMMYYYTDAVGIAPGTVGTMMLIAAIWDGINDPLMGMLIDHTRTRWGKCKPYIVAGSIAICVFIILCLNIPEIGDTGKIVYMYVTYIGMGMAFTCANMAISIQLTRFTRNQTEVASLNAWAYFANSFSGMIIAASVMTMLTAFSGPEGNLRLGYGRMGWVFAGITLITVVAAALTKERDYFAEEAEARGNKIPFKDYLKAVVTNKPYLILIAASAIVLICYMFWMSVIVYYCNYNLNDASRYSPITTVINIACFIPIFVLVPLTKRFDKKHLYIASLVIVIIGMGLRYLTNDSTIFSIYLLILIAFLGYGLWTILLSPMLVDCASYQRIKTGIDTSGVVLCSVTMVSKIGTGISQSVLGSLMEKYGYVEGATTQNEAVLSLFRHCNITVMLVGAAMSIIIISFYKLKDKELAKMEAVVEAELEAKTAAAEEI